MKLLSVTKVCFLLSLLMLFVGGMIYLNFRPHTLYMFSLLRKLSLEDWFPMKLFDSNSKLLSFCVYSLPNGLWATSAIILFGLVWKNSEKIFLIYSVIFTMGNLIFEFLQFFCVIPGTFDYVDVLVILIPLLLGILTYKFFLKAVLYE